MLRPDTIPHDASPTQNTGSIDDPAERLRFVVDTVRELSIHTDPQELIKVFRRRAFRLYGADASLSLSRRDLDRPFSRITRSSRWDEDINPWKEKDRLPLCEGGMLADVIYGDEPCILNGVCICDDDPAYEYLKDARSLVCIPLYERGVGLNMVVRMSYRANYFDPLNLGDAVLESNLFGRATAGLVQAQRAEAAYERAIELDPNEPQARIFYSHFLAMMQRKEESDEQIKRAVEIDPLNPFTQMLYGIQLGLTGRYDEAFEQLANVPPNPLRSQALAVLDFNRGRLSEALKHYVQYFELLGDHEMVSAMQDDGAGAQAAMIRGAETLVDRASRMFVKPEGMLILFSWGGDIDRGMEWLERSYETRDHQVAYVGAVGGAVYGALRGDPRFHEFLRRLKLPVPEVVS
ncbi:MAG: hypothetical protein IH987_10075 [Planctomycetes bacterium]|nr:hypothetical protein [Planctomycetota bacterium]